MRRRPWAELRGAAGRRLRPGCFIRRFGPAVVSGGSRGGGAGRAGSQGLCRLHWHTTTQLRQQTKHGRVAGLVPAGVRVVAVVDAGLWLDTPLLAAPPRAALSAAPRVSLGDQARAFVAMAAPQARSGAG